MIRILRKVTDEVKDDETSKKDGLKTKTEEESGGMQPNQQIMDSRSIGLLGSNRGDSQVNTGEKSKLMVVNANNQKKKQRLLSNSEATEEEDNE